MKCCPIFNRESGWQVGSFAAQVIWLANCSIAVDLRIRGEFAPPQFDVG